MREFETAQQAESFDGDKMYQQRARAALPLLVRQAKAQKTIFYADLAKELNIPNPRNLNFVLGSVGQSILKLARERGEEIPPIQCLVVNQADGLPGEGVDFFIEKHAFKGMSKRQRRVVVDGLLQKIFSYPGWDSVLEAFSMKAAPLDFSTIVRNAALGGREGGESEHHKFLKEHVAANPGILGLRPSVAKGVNEYGLPSGDKLDVLFREVDEWIAVEVKSHISDDADLVRGLFQCVKYQAVLEAFLISTDRKPNARAALVISRPFPVELLPLKNVLGVEVIEIPIPL
ncbi:MAG: hypothetical protein V4675_19085 [Verrucomicrobiota bacterium]